MSEAKAAPTETRILKEAVWVAPSPQRGGHGGRELEAPRGFQTDHPFIHGLPIRKDITQFVPNYRTPTQDEINAVDEATGSKTPPIRIQTDEPVVDTQYSPITPAEALAADWSIIPEESQTSRLLTDPPDSDLAESLLFNTGRMYAITRVALLEEAVKLIRGRTTFKKAAKDYVQTILHSFKDLIRTPVKEKTKKFIAQIVSEDPDPNIFLEASHSPLPDWEPLNLKDKSRIPHYEGYALAGQVIDVSGESEHVSEVRAHILELTIQGAMLRENALHTPPGQLPDGVTKEPTIVFENGTLFHRVVVDRVTDTDGKTYLVPSLRVGMDPTTSVSAINAVFDEANKVFESKGIGLVRIPDYPTPQSTQAA